MHNGQDRDSKITKRSSCGLGWEGVVKLTKECFDFSKWVSSPACSFMTDADVDDDECVEFLKPI